MPSSSVFVGVDGGATKTACAVVDSEGGVLGTHKTGSGNWNSVGKEQAGKNVRDAVLGALEAAGKAPADVAIAAFSMSGVDRPSDIEEFRINVVKYLPASRVLVENDAVAALCAGTQGVLEGIVVIAGTGTITWGAKHPNSRARAAGCGPLLGDVGSGHFFGNAALTAVMKAHDGRGPPTTLQQRILSHLKLEQEPDIIGWIYSDLSWDRVAAIAPIVFSCEKEGDSVASAIVKEGVEGIRASIAAVASRLAFPDNSFTLVLAGGLFDAENQTGLDVHVEQRICSEFPKVTVRHTSIEASIAAALWAKSEQVH